MKNEKLTKQIIDQKAALLISHQVSDNEQIQKDDQLEIIKNLKVLVVNDEFFILIMLQQMI